MNEDYQARKEIVMLRSQVDQLKGKVESILEDARSKAKKIQKLEDKQRKLDGFRSNMS